MLAAQILFSPSWMDHLHRVQCQVHHRQHDAQRQADSRGALQRRLVPPDPAFDLLDLSFVAIADDPAHVLLQLALISQHTFFETGHGYTSIFSTVEYVEYRGGVLPSNCLR